MLEFMVSAFRSLFRFARWVSGGQLLDALHDRRPEQQVLSREARASKSVKPLLELERISSRRFA